METNQVYDEGCSHCVHNPTATKPYDVMKRITLGKQVTAELEKQGLDPSCYMCHSVRRILEVSRKLRKNERGK